MEMAEAVNWEERYLSQIEAGIEDLRSRLDVCATEKQLTALGTVMEAKMASLETAVETKITSMEAKMASKDELKETKTELAAKIDRLEGKIDRIFWVFGGLFAAAIVGGFVKLFIG